MSHFNFADGMLRAGLQALDLYVLLGIIAALLLGGMVKGVVSIGAPLVAVPRGSACVRVVHALLLND